MFSIHSTRMVLKAVALLSCVLVAQTQAQTMNDQINDLIVKDVQGLKTISSEANKNLDYYTFQAQKVSNRQTHLVKLWWNFIKYFLIDNLEDIAYARNITLSCEELNGLDAQWNMLDDHASGCLANNTQLRDGVAFAESYETTGVPLQEQAKQTKNVEQLLTFGEKSATLFKQAMVAYTRLLDFGTEFSAEFSQCLVRGDNTVWTPVKRRITDRRSCVLGYLDDE